MDLNLISPQFLADQQSIVCDVFVTMAGITVVTTEAHRAGPEPISFILNYSRALEGTVLIECSHALAYLFTERLMSIDPPVSLDRDVEDAIGELTNMIGGNLKGLMSPDTCISIPLLLGTAQRYELLARTVRVARTCFNADAGHFCVSILKPTNIEVFESETH